MTAAPQMLLLQARNPGDEMLEHEVECFARNLGVAAEQLHPHNLTQGPATLAAALQYDAVLVGGAGEYAVSKGNLPQQEAFLELLAEVVARRQPMFASCYGFHGMVAALGGEVRRVAERMETGTFELTRTEAGAADELFGALPPVFWAQEGHSDQALQMPEGLPNLAASELTPKQALRVPDAPIWATQFHPELDYAGAAARFDYFLKHQGKPEEIPAMLARLKESPEANALLRRFVELVFG